MLIASVVERLEDISLNSTLETRYKLTIIFQILKALPPDELEVVKNDLLAWEGLLNNMGILYKMDVLNIVDIVDILGVNHYETVIKKPSDGPLKSHDILKIKEQFLRYLKTLDAGKACTPYLIAYAKYLSDHNQLTSSLSNPSKSELRFEVTQFKLLSTLQVKRFEKVYSYQFTVSKDDDLKRLTIECQFPNNSTSKKLSLPLPKDTGDITQFAKFFYNDTIYLLIGYGGNQSEIISFHYSMHVKHSEVILQQNIPLEFDDIHFIDGDLNYPYCWYFKPKSSDNHVIMYIPNLANIENDYSELLVKLDHLPYKDIEEDQISNSSSLMRVILPINHKNVNSVHIAYLCRESFQYVLYLYHCNVSLVISSESVIPSLTYLNHLKIVLGELDPLEKVIDDMKIIFLNETVFYIEFLTFETGESTQKLFEYDNNYKGEGNLYKEHEIRNMDASKLIRSLLKRGGRILIYLTDLPSLDRMFNLVFYDKNLENDKVQLHFVKIIPFETRVHDYTIDINLRSIDSFSLAFQEDHLLYIEDLEEKNHLVIIYK